MDRSGDRDARRLVLLIMGNLAEFFNGDLQESELRQRLGLLTPSTRTYVRGQQVAHLSATRNRSQEATVPAGTSREVAPA
jgi:hypothetical protein